MVQFGEKIASIETQIVENLQVNVQPLQEVLEILTHHIIGNQNQEKPDVV
jgi:hypothetical protein